MTKNGTITGRLVLLLPLSLALSLGCPAPTPAGDCTDGRDNDGDGLIDYDDPGCVLSDGILEADPPQCEDGLDNDGDGAIDLEDPGCENAADTDEEDPLVECNDGFDNDLDGLIDFPDDPGCDGPVDPEEFNNPLCSDGRDNDGDGLTDYPVDPGCSLPTDEDEDDPNPLPDCADNEDNDLDGLIDFPADPGCDAASDNNEFNFTVGACGPMVFIEDITLTRQATGLVDGPTLSELSGACGGFGGEFAFTYQVTEPTALRISTDHPETTLDTVVYVRGSCQAPETELGCDDDGGLQRRTSVLNLPRVEPDTYYILVDAFSPGSLGDFKLTVEELPPLGSDCTPGAPDACLDGLVCREVTPGSGFTCELPVCSDLEDNDGDGLIDYPFDPGCSSPDGDDEQNPNPVTECSDGIDNDLDGDTDYPDDLGCTDAADDIEETCGDTAPLLDISYQPTTDGLTVVAGNNSTGTCEPSSENAPDVVHRLKVPGTLDSLTLNTNGSSFDTVLYVRQGACGGVELACDDNDGAGSNSLVNLSNVAPGNYYIFVDGWNTSAGSYELSVAGVIQDNAICDPAQIAAGVLSCDTGATCMDDGMGAMRCL